jgi:hypothetical protein
MLLTGSGDEFCGPLPALFQAVAYHPPAVSPSAFLVFVTDSLSRDQLLAPPSLSGALTAPCPFCCVFLFSSLFYYSGFVCLFVFCRVGISLPKEYAGLSQGWPG